MINFFFLLNNIFNYIIEQKSWNTITQNRNKKSLSKSFSWFPLDINGSDKNSFWINRNGSKCFFRLMEFHEFTINHNSRWELQVIISEILVHHNQGWARNLHLKLFLFIDLLKKLMILWRFCIIIMGCVGITVYWSKTFFYPTSWGKHCIRKTVLNIFW